MTYRIATPKDIPAINELCDKNGLSHPTLEFCFVAEHDGKLIAYINAMNVRVLDCVGENSLAMKTLYDMMFGGLVVSGAKMVMAYTIKDNVEKLLKKLGYIKAKDKMNIFVKEL